ncbi:MAG: hypothetical protein ABIV23_03860 [Sphingomicrobium sp.]
MSGILGMADMSWPACGSAATGFCAGVFLTVVRLATGFLTTAFFATDFFAAGFFAAGFLAGIGMVMPGMFAIDWADKGASGTAASAAHKAIREIIETLRAIGS